MSVRASVLSMVNSGLLWAVSMTVGTPATACCQTTFTWNQPGDGNFTTATWVNGPVASDNTNTLVFGGSSAYIATNNVGGAAAVFIANSFQFNNTSSGGVTLAAAGTRSFRIGGTTPNVVQNGTSPVAFTAPFQVNAASTFAGSGSGPISFSTLNQSAGLTLSGAFDVGFAAYQAQGAARTITNNLAGGSTLTVGTAYLSDSATAGYGLTVQGAGNTRVTGSVADFNGTGLAGTLTKAGPGTLTLAGANSFTGATSVTNGTLVLDFTANNGSKLAPAAGLSLSNATVSAVGNATASSVQAVAGLTLSNGDSAITVRAGGEAFDATLSLGAITRNGTATLNIGLVNSGSGRAIVTTTLANTAAGVLGGAFVANGTDWASRDDSLVAGRVVPLGASANVASVAAWASNQNVSDTGTGGFTGALPADLTVGSVRFNTPAASTANLGGATLTVGTGSGALGTGGILVTPAAGAASIVNGSLTASGNDLILQQYNTTPGNRFVISAAVVDRAGGAIGVTKAGPGLAVLAGVNGYTGPTFVNRGVLLVNGSTTATSTVTARTSGTLGGTGTINGPVVINGQATIAPGDPLANAGVGQLTLANGGATTVNGGGSYAWQIANAAGTAGTVGTSWPPPAPWLGVRRPPPRS